ncbi:MAG: hypothetical protein LJE70_21045 [Chromatiaceae bacterium]|jgi:uncharacterized protein (DUF4213/DUF364 family)|nr:hypothetical protein [Chromatiaceae bacterium]
MNRDYLRIGQQMAMALGHPTVAGLYLPDPVPDETFRDRFGFVFLSDGSVAPFYVSMGDILRTLWARYPQPRDYVGDTLELLQGFMAQDLATRALALGVYNALSAALISGSGFALAKHVPISGLDDVRPEASVGMVGYFCPLVDKLIERGCDVVILELAPERVSPRTDVTVTRKPQDLRDCQLVLCTASVLINDTLEDLLEVVSSSARFEVIGPSGSGLPDPLFARGVAKVGGVRFADKDGLLERLSRSESWGTTGCKYQLSAASYPGFDRLVRMLRQ